MKEALKQILDLLQPVAALADGTPFEHSEVIQRCVDASEIALETLAQPTSGDFALGYAEGFNDACKPKPAQEPTGMLHIDRLDKWLDASLKERKSQRTWVGLDEKDFSAINQSCLTKLQAATSAESILKEKNT